jgi:hypothetical protein
MAQYDQKGNVYLTIVRAYSQPRGNIFNSGISGVDITGGCGKIIEIRKVEKIERNDMVLAL